MKALRDAIYSKKTGSSLDTLINGQLFYGKAPAGTRYPYVVFFIVTQSPEKNFTEYFTDTTVQFSVFSATPYSSTEAYDISEAIKSLYDECSITITGHYLTWMIWSNVVGPEEDDTISQDGADGGWACHLDFEIKTHL